MLGPCGAEKGGRKRLTYICCMLYPRLVRFALGAFQRRWQHEGCRIPDGFREGGILWENVIFGSEKVVKFRAVVVRFYDGESGQDARGDGGR